VHPGQNILIEGRLDQLYEQTFAARFCASVVGLFPYQMVTIVE
jgi:hypothetical protein